MLIKKVILTGLDCSGKTSILNVLENNKIVDGFNLRPTRGLNIRKFGNGYYVWDFGGVMIYRERFLINRDMYFPSTRELVYLIDINNSENFSESLDFLCQILEIFKKFEATKELERDFIVFVFLTKSDLVIKNSINICERINFIKKSLKKLSLPFGFLIKAISIFNFKAEVSFDVFGPKIVPYFGNVLINAFSN